MIINNLEDLARYWGIEPTKGAISKAVYKGTNCGAWAEPFPAHETWDGKLANAGISFGSIVEGAEQGTQVYTVYFPCNLDEIGRALDSVEEEALEIWNQTHGCEHCWGGDIYVTEWGEEIGPEDYGMRPVDPDCPSCGGHGIVI